MAIQTSWSFPTSSIDNVLFIVKGYRPALPTPGYCGNLNPGRGTSGAVLGVEGEDYIIKKCDVINYFSRYDLF
ncbi:hypothetical protein KWH77_03605 [Enterobacter sichuanensis]|uniref:hypothetical protein n=1 Tax=Enterobacter sichuanensis TaxID=2071710 RepID=UPI0021D17FC1|nr:hypothetical protein [Enterobacter sichuanensis]MCU6425281.1 hypothetical protein [Enterobacter sichuanensis]